MARTPRSAADDPGIICAQLDGHARWLLRNKVDPERCVVELHEITTDPALLGRAAGTALGAWQHSPVSGHEGDRVARMLAAAGADPAVRDQRAAETKARLEVDAGRPGIGMPG